VQVPRPCQTKMPPGLANPRVPVIDESGDRIAATTHVVACSNPSDQTRRPCGVHSWTYRAAALGRARGWASPARAASGVVASSTNESGDLVLLGEVAGLPIDRLELKQAAPMRAMGRLADRCWLTAAVTRGAGQGEASRVRHDGRSCACPAVRPRLAAARPVGASAPCRSADRSGWLAGR